MYRTKPPMIISSSFQFTSSLAHSAMTSQQSFTTSLTVPRLSRTIALLGATRDVLPCGVEPASCGCKQTFLLLFLKIAIDLLLVDLGHLEQGCEKCDQVDAQESELRPEEDDAEEGEVDGDAVDEGAEDGGCADILGRWVGGELAAWLDQVSVL